MTSFQSSQKWTPQLLFKLPVHQGDVNDSIFIPGHEVIVSGSEDRTIRIYQEKSPQKYWPSHVETVPSPVTVLAYDPTTRRLFAGLDNGTIMEFMLTEDANSITRKHDYLAHMGRITGMVYSIENEWILSVSKDKTLTWHSVQKHEQLGCHSLDHPCTCIAYDSATKHLFVGDSSGTITLLSITQLPNGSCECSVTKQLRGHNKAVTSLSWDSVKYRLLSSSEDQVVILWDIGSGRGTAYDLHAHSQSVTSVGWWLGHWPGAVQPGTEAASRSNGVIVSGGADGQLVFWLVTPDRQPSPDWAQSDTCQLCNAAFFWNIRKMFHDKSVGARQHHCRRCGKAVCDNCSPYQVRLPSLGFEINCRICKVCQKTTCNNEENSLIMSVDTKAPITNFHIDENRHKLVTVDREKMVKVWDLKKPN